MKLLSILILCICAVSSFAQEMMQPIPKKELEAVSFFAGDWTGKETFTMGPGNASEGKSTVSGKIVLGGRYISSTHKMMIGSGQEMQGMHMLTYDLDKKKYLGYWFDSAAPGIMEMEGELKGSTLQMISKPTEMPGMGKVVFRATWTLKGKKDLHFTLEMAEGDKWNKMIEGNYTRN